MGNCDIIFNIGRDSYMPSQVTHSYFAIDVYNKLDDFCKCKVKNNLKKLKTFSLGPDPFYFYNMFIEKKHKYVDSLGRTMHIKNTKKYFTSIIKYIINNKLQNNKDVMTYLYGSICHYYLDKTTHPYTMYKTGEFDRNNKDTYKYNAIHQEMEYYIDIYFIKMKENTQPNKYKYYKNIFSTDKLDNHLCDMIDNIISDVYKIDNASKLYFKSIKNMYIFNRLFNYDRFGIKKTFYKIVDKIQPKKYIKKEEISFYVKPFSKIHFLNLEKKEWNHPCFLNEIYNYSFIELYMIAINRCVNCINDITKMLENKKINNTIIDKYFDNSSYTTGKDCDLELEIKYFEF